MTGSRARAAPRAEPGSVTGTAPRAPTGSGRSWGKSLPSDRASRLSAWAERPCPRGRAGRARVLRRLPRSFTLYYAPFNRAAGPSCRGGEQSPPLAGARRGGLPAWWCGWGSWDDSGRAFVQICCKGAPRPDRPREEARNINDPLPASRLDRGLCNRFGQPAPPRAPGGVAMGRAATTTGAPMAERGPRTAAPPGPRGRAPVPPGRRGSPVDAPRRARSSLDPRDRLLEVRARGSSDDFGGYPTVSRTAAPIRDPRALSAGAPDNASAPRLPQQGSRPAVPPPPRTPEPERLAATVH